MNRYDEGIETMIETRTDDMLLLAPLDDLSCIESFSGDIIGYPLSCEADVAW